ncbi:MAG: HAMP domain-containing protein [bacterium]
MEHSKRRLSNVKLTSKFHFRYLGLWVLITVALIAVAGLLLFLLAEEHWSALYTLDTKFQDNYMMQRQAMAMALGFGALMLSAAIMVLAKTTAHRIAGPYIKLQRVFEAVRDGNFDQELKFRQYDHLEELAAAFNEMMTEVRSRVKKENPPN